MKKRVYYTKEQQKKILELFDNNASKKEIEFYAKSLGRSYLNLYQQYHRLKNPKKYKSVNKEKQKPATIKVTHINKPVEIQRAIAHIGSVRIEIPSNTLTIGEVKLEW